MTRKDLTDPLDRFSRHAPVIDITAHLSKSKPSRIPGTSLMRMQREYEAKGEFHPVGGGPPLQERERWTTRRFGE
jgi:hypothetical protein